MNSILDFSHYRSNKIPTQGTKFCSLQESAKNITPSIQTWIKELNALIFEKDELEHRDMSILMALLPLLVNEDSNYDVENNFDFMKKRMVSLK